MEIEKIICTDMEDLYKVINIVLNEFGTTNGIIKEIEPRMSWWRKYMNNEFIKYDELEILILHFNKNTINSLKIYEDIKHMYKFSQEQLKKLEKENEK